jgi:hypothetical protein
VLAPKQEAPIRHIEFVSLSPTGRWWCWSLPMARSRTGCSAAAGADAVLDARGGEFPECAGRRADHGRIARHDGGEIARRRQEIDSLARELVESGLAVWENAGQSSERLIVRGRANLLEKPPGYRRRPHPQPVRRPGTQARHRRIPEPDRGGRRRAHLHRLREQALFTFGFQSGGFSLYER